TVEDFERRMQVWVERLEAAERHGARLDLIGASSVKRGTARGQAEVAAVAAVVAAPVAVVTDARGADAREADARELGGSALPEIAAPEPARETAAEAVVEAQERAAEPSQDDAITEELPATEAPAEDGTADAVDVADEAVDEVDEKPYVPQTSFEALPDLEARVKEVFGRTRPLPWEQPVPETPSAPAVEPPTVTGHTRRVELFDLARPAAETSAAATDEATPGEDPTVERDRRIVELARQGMNQREIAQKVSASRSTVSRVVRRYEDQKPLAEEDERELANA